MTELTWHEGNQGIFDYRDLSGFELISLSDGGAVLAFDEAVEPYDPLCHAWRVELTFEGAQSYTVQTGPDAGDKLFTAGRITSVTYFDADGMPLLDVTGVKASLPLLSAWLNAGTGFGELFDGIAGQGGHYTGSEDASGALTSWNGDDVRTSLGGDVVHALGGDDYIRELAGRDKYVGGSGWDTLDYAAAFERPDLVKRGIKVDLHKKYAIGYDGKKDVVKGIEAVAGTYMADKILGSKGDNRLIGYQGEDVLNGRGGYDEVDYAFDAQYGGSSGIVVDLFSGRARDGFGTWDTLKSIEGVLATSAADDLSDDGRNNYFRAGDGDDVVRISGGDDFVNIGLDDTGADTIIFRGSDFGDNTVLGFRPSDGDRLDIEAATSFDDLVIWQNNGNAVIAYAGGSVTLIDQAAVDLSADDFLF